MSSPLLFHDFSLIYKGSCHEKKLGDASFLKSLILSPDGSQLLSTHENSIVKIWALDDQLLESTAYYSKESSHDDKGINCSPLN